MGADLYIQKLYKPARAEWEPKFNDAVARRNAAITDEERESAQKAVTEIYDRMYPDEGYFRDSYNGTGVLGVVGLSWWRDLETDIDSEENPDGNNMSVGACRNFLIKLRKAGPPEPVNRDWLLSRHCSVDDGENSPEKWNEFYAKKYERLVSFFESAIEHGGMFASV